jgi:hypothetical protein
MMRGTTSIRPIAIAVLLGGGICALPGFRGHPSANAETERVEAVFNPWGAGPDETPPSSKGFTYSVPSKPSIPAPVANDAQRGQSTPAIRKQPAPGPEANSSTGGETGPQPVNLKKLLIGAVLLLIGIELVFLVWNDGRRFRRLLYGSVSLVILVFISIVVLRRTRAPAAGDGDVGEILREHVAGLRYVCAGGPHQVYDFMEDGQVKTLNEVNGAASPGPSYEWMIRNARLVLVAGRAPMRTFSFMGQQPGLITIRGDDGVILSCEYSRSPALGTGKL